MSELKPCPLCGGRSTLYAIGDIRCIKCGLILPFGWSCKIETLEEAIEAWNRRWNDAD